MMDFIHYADHDRKLHNGGSWKNSIGLKAVCSAGSQVPDIDANISVKPLQNGADPLL